MKINLFLVCFLITLFCNAQQHFPCDNSPIGKLITKPLLKNGEIHYELANKKLIKAEHTDGVYISRIDSMQQNTLYRIHHFTKDSAVMLEYNYDERHKSCNYFFSVGGKEKKFSLNARLDSNGKIDKTSTVDTPIREDRQSQIDSLLKYFE